MFVHSFINDCSRSQDVLSSRNFRDATAKLMDLRTEFKVYLQYKGCDLVLNREPATLRNGHLSSQNGSYSVEGRGRMNWNACYGWCPNWLASPAFWKTPARGRRRRRRSGGWGGGRRKLNWKSSCQQGKRRVEQSWRIYLSENIKRKSAPGPTGEWASRNDCGREQGNPWSWTSEPWMVLDKIRFSKFRIKSVSNFVLEIRISKKKDMSNAMKLFYRITL